MVTATGVFQRATSKRTFLIWSVVVLVILIPVTAVLVYVFAVEGDPVTVDEWAEKYGPVVGITLVHRHGLRTINTNYPKDPYLDAKYWPEGIGGEITKKGITQHYQQGRWIASQYKHLIPGDHFGITKGIRVVSTDWNRTIVSAEAELMGMFEIHDDVDSWAGLRSYLVPIHVIPHDDDALMEVTKPCPRLAALKNKNIQSERYQRMLKDTREVANVVEANFGTVVEGLFNYLGVFSTISIEKERGHTLGKWVDDLYPSPLRELCAIGLASETWTRDLKRLRGGPFIKEVIENIRRKVNDPGFRSVSIYSAHDTTITAFLNSMNDLYEKEDVGPPNSAALVVVEHRRKGNMNYVRILYRCPYPKEESPDCHFDPRVLTIPGCDEFCPFDKMVELLRDVIPDDWEAECQKMDDLEGPSPTGN